MLSEFVELEPFNLYASRFVQTSFFVTFVGVSLIDIELKQIYTW